MSDYTSVVGAGCTHDIDVSMLVAINDGVFDGPRITPCGHHIETTGGENDKAKWWCNIRPPYQDGVSIVDAEAFCDGADALRREIRAEINRGVNVIKIFPTGSHGFEVHKDKRELSAEELEVSVETAHDRSAAVRGAEALLECAGAGVDIIDHGDGLDERCIETMVMHSTFFVPSLLFLRTLLDRPGDVPEVLLAPVKNDFEHMVLMMPEVQRAGVKVVPGDDYGVKFIPHIPGTYSRDLAVHVDYYGISALNVLKWVTANGGALCRRENDLGKIDKIYLADLIVVDGDPTKDLALLSDPDSNVPLIMLGGKIVKDQLGSGDNRGGARVLLRAEHGVLHGSPIHPIHTYTRRIASHVNRKGTQARVARVRRGELGANLGC
jgi:imidazolonepropionase-like amidohydrolase